MDEHAYSLAHRLGTIPAPLKLRSYGAIEIRLLLAYYYAALLRRRGPHIALHSVCPSVCLSVRLSVRPVIVYIRTSVTCFRQPCGRAVSFVLFTCQGRI